MLEVDYLALNEIQLDDTTKPRVCLNLKHIKVLEHQIEDGQKLDPVVVFYDGESYWLADGFHRWYAHRNQEEEVIACAIHQGSRRDAVLYSVGANADNKPALPRSQEDKRRAVMTLLNDPEWSAWSDREIARLCKVHHSTVSTIRQLSTSDLSSNVSSQSLTGELASHKRTYKTRHGTVAKMNTANIGKKAALTNVSQVAAKDYNFLGLTNLNTLTLANSTRQMIQLKNLHMEKPVSSRTLVAHHLQLAELALVEIHVPNNNKINGRLGRIAIVSESIVEVWLRDVNTMIMQKHRLKHQQVEPVPIEREPELAQVCDRISKLRSCSLDPMELEILLLLDRPVVFTSLELKFLALIEERFSR